MKLLLDENLSPRLIDRLTPLYPEIAHVRDNGLKQSDDRTIWNWAKENHHTIVTTDADFIELSQRLGSPPKVIFIERRNFPFSCD